MNGQTKRGRKPAPNPRKLVGIYLTDAELAEVDQARGTTPRSVYVRQIFLLGFHSAQERYLRYQDSGQAARDEAADIAEELAE